MVMIMVCMQPWRIHLMYARHAACVVRTNHIEDYYLYFVAGMGGAAPHHYEELALSFGVAEGVGRARPWPYLRGVFRFVRTINVWAPRAVHSSATVCSSVSLRAASTRATIVSANPSSHGVPGAPYSMAPSGPVDYLAASDALRA